MALNDRQHEAMANTQVVVKTVEKELVLMAYPFLARNGTLGVFVFVAYSDCIQRSSGVSVSVRFGCHGCAFDVSDSVLLTSTRYAEEGGRGGGGVIFFGVSAIGIDYKSLWH